MIARRARSRLEAALDRQAAVALLGPRQVGKTTLAHAVGENRDALYLDLEAPEDRAKLQDAALFLRAYEDRLVILDEIHRVPEIFQTLRSLIDQGRRRGHRSGRFLILGSASMELLKQSGESLAGRIAYVELAPVDVLETKSTAKALQTLWVRGGFPDALLAGSDEESMAIRRDFIRTYLERDIPMLGPRVPAETMRRLWTMLAHNQGATLNASRLASGLSVSSPTVSRYIDLLVDLLLVRRLEPLHANVGKRLVKSPKVYVRDSGLLHALLGLEDHQDILGHPVAGGSWEGFAIESLLAAAPAGTDASFYRTSAGAEVDLVLNLPKRRRWIVEVKHSLSPTPSKGFHNSREDLKPQRSLVAYPGQDAYPVGNGVEAVPLRTLAAQLAEL